MMLDKKIWIVDFFSLNMFNPSEFNLEVKFVQHSPELNDIINKSVIVLKYDENVQFLVSYYQIPLTRILRRYNVKANIGDEILIMAKGGFYYVRVSEGNHK